MKEKFLLQSEDSFRMQHSSRKVTNFADFVEYDGKNHKGNEAAEYSEKLLLSILQELL